MSEKRNLPPRAVFAGCRLLSSALLVLLLESCASPIPDRPAADFSLEQVERALDEGSLAAAMAGLPGLLEAFPDDPRVLALAVRTYARADRTGPLENATRRLLESDPANAYALEQLGLLRLEEGHLASAENYLTLAVAEEPSRWMAWNGLGVIADLDSRFTEAQASFRRALDIVPGHPKVLANLGWSLILADKPEQAEPLLRQALAIAPDSATTRSNLAFSIALQGRYEEAISLYERHYDRSVAANNVGYAAMLRDDKAAARRYLNMALELKPNYYRKAANNLAGLR